MELRRFGDKTMALYTDAGCDRFTGGNSGFALMGWVIYPEKVSNTWSNKFFAEQRIKIALLIL